MVTHFFVGFRAQTYFTTDGQSQTDKQTDRQTGAQARKSKALARLATSTPPIRENIIFIYRKEKSTGESKIEMKYQLIYASTKFLHDFNL